jgi:hypothetical protein
MEKMLLWLQCVPSNPHVRTFIPQGDCIGRWLWEVLVSWSQNLRASFLEGMGWLQPEVSPLLCLPHAPACFSTFLLN